METNVNDGTMTSSPGSMSSRTALISRASVHDVVSRTLGEPSMCASKAWHFFVNGPFPDAWRS